MLNQRRNEIQLSAAVIAQLSISITEKAQGDLPLLKKQKSTDVIRWKD